MKLSENRKSGWSILIFAGLTLFCLSGCANMDILDSGDMKDVELVTALSLDLAENDEVEVTVQLLNRDKALDRQYTESYYNLTAAGVNLPAAIGELYRYGARQLNFSHTSVLLLAENAADADFWLDYALRSPELRPTVYPVVCRGQAGEIITGAAASPDISLTYLLDNILEPLGNGRPGAAAVSLQSFIGDLMQPGITPALPMVEQQEEGSLALCGIVLYDDNGRQAATLAADSDEQAYEGWLWLRRPEYLRGFLLELDNGVVLQVESAALQKELQVSAAKPNLQFRLSLRAKVLRNPQSLPDAYLQQLTKQRLQDYTVAALAASREHNLDFLGIGREVYRQQPELWQEFTGQNYLQRLTVSLEVKAEISQQ